MATVTITATQANTQRIMAAIKYFYPIPKDPITGLPLYTDAQWFIKQLENQYKRLVSQYESIIAQRAVAVPIDNNLLTITTGP